MTAKDKVQPAARAEEKTEPQEFTPRAYKFKGQKGHPDDEELIVFGIGAFKKGESVTSYGPEHAALIEASGMFSAGAMVHAAQEE